MEVIISQDNALTSGIQILVEIRNSREPIAGFSQQNDRNFGYIRTIKTLIYIPLLLSFASLSQQGNNFDERYVDSLKRIAIKLEKKDTLIVAVYKEIAEYYFRFSQDERNKGFSFMDMGIQQGRDRGAHYSSIDLQIDKGMALGRMNNDWKRAYEIFKEAAKLSEKKGFTDLQARAYFSLAYADWLFLANMDKAVEHGIRCVDLYKKVRDRKNLARVYNLLGLVYEEIKEYDKTIDYYKKAASIHDSIGDTNARATIAYNLGLIYIEVGKLGEANRQLEKAYKLYESKAHKSAYPMVYTGFGKLRLEQGRLNDALDYFNKALAINLNDNWTSAGIYLGLGETHVKMGNFSRALPDLLKALSYAQVGAYPAYERSSHELLAQVYAELGNYKDAYYHHIRFFEINDSIAGREKADNIARLENRQNELRIQNLEKEKELQDAELKASDEYNARQTLITYGIGGGFLIVISFSLILYNRLKLTRVQKKIIEEKNSEITDSIRYAKRIQSAILPRDADLKKHLPASFVLYQPKDIVAGDFYWLDHVDGKTLFAVADCTGHGVPGAMVSVVCNNALNRAVREFGIIEPGEILNKVREIVIMEFRKSGEDVKDGMDITLCLLDGNRLLFAGANNSLWLYRDDTIAEYKADRQPIGKFENSTPFNTQRIDLKRGDILYLHTDGYADQFGGERGKKYRSKGLRDYIISIADQPMDTQCELLASNFIEWKGELEQIDDICVMGVKIN